MSTAYCYPDYLFLATVVLSIEREHIVFNKFSIAFHVMDYEGKSLQNNWVDWVVPCRIYVLTTKMWLFGCLHSNLFVKPQFWYLFGDYLSFLKSTMFFHFTFTLESIMLRELLESEYTILSLLNCCFLHQRDKLEVACRCKCVLFLNFIISIRLIFQRHFCVVCSFLT